MLENLNVTYIWLIAGILFILLEAIGMPGVGLLFVGLGAVIVGILINFGFIAEHATLTQFIIFFIATAAWAALLWRPMQKLKLGRQESNYSNIIGDTAYVGSGGINKAGGGEVTWSGTIMKAEIAPEIKADRLEAGTQVVVVNVSGATLIVKPKA